MFFINIYIYIMQLQTKHIFIGVIILIFIYLLNSNTEGYKNFCGNCQDLTEKECAECPNCGICEREDGCKSCVRGDPSGPYFKDGCVGWTYMKNKTDNKCRNLNETTPHDCGLFYPYKKRSINHIEYAAMHKQLGTGPTA
jgi:hypothetical protein